MCLNKGIDFGFLLKNTLIEKSIQKMDKIEKNTSA